MVYQVKRTYIVHRGRDATMKTDRRSDYFDAENAFGAAMAFIRETGSVVVGEIAAFADDTAVATCVLVGRTFVIRAASVGSDEAALSKLKRGSGFSRRAGDPRDPSP